MDRSKILDALGAVIQAGLKADPMHWLWPRISTPDPSSPDGAIFKKMQHDTAAPEEAERAQAW
ncbi:hypothetical protein [Variovorax boronicumulans]|uniref:hypothetical protein n=1 Tax=Variovorax boronicumulans TaxID=436515 RepID=UPI00117D6025|nr:hypothetical protein [Variovorax boronicumulans]